MEKMSLALAALLCASACGNVEGLTSEDIFGLRASPNARLSGQVRRSDTGAPVAGASVQVQGYSMQTDRNGAYRIEELIGRSATLSVSIHGFHPYTATLNLMAGENAHDVTLAAHECGRVTCESGEFCFNGACVKGSTLTGSVVSDCDGAPVDARVTIDGKSTCSTASSGKAYFQLKELTPGGPHTLSIGKPGYQAFSTQLSLAPGLNAFDTVRLIPIGGCPGQPSTAACTCTEPSCQ